ncbi:MULTISPECIES: hypothetical protein [Bradyrhizobium]|uniref:hypothetical protein n=1 Tax=Bradyrhizobium TaxID=374 RepID=UPI000486B04E|nr:MULTISPECIES: hypothetical protein [Bradyrhizobium]MBR1004254.1 hypothetical protein [Bradyrhizobium liaoningense]MCP1749019.1 hypothetical protein [Bradyrhizobium japonicum]MCP1855038.1 hypothetical protein [Bradyrhizobium japonicum]MCP1897921.1 hypothetical protein [Bradyrhizobium japonicum]MCW2330857.1 hypothetical protein [Bradyrhizobium japonicum]
MSDYPPSQKLWRYMSFSRFMWLLQRKLLWIGRSDTLDDPWELAITPTYLEEVRLRAPITPIGQEHRETADEHAAKVYGHWRRTTFISCWCASEHESLALWRVFCGDKEGVAIQTTVGRLEAHFGNVALRKVRYAEPKALGRTLTLDDVAILKRPFFDFEKEARAIFRDDTPNPKLDKGEFGFRFPFDPAEVLESVAIHPGADISFYETVLWAIDDHAKPLRDNVSWSSMRERPPFQKPLPYPK